MPDARAGLDHLVTAAAAGERSALESLLLHFHDPLFGFIKNTLCPHPGPIVSPEDVLQETLVAAFRGIDTLQPQGSDAFFGWLKKIAATRRLNMVRSGKAIKRGSGKAAMATPADSSVTATAILNLLAGDGPSPSRIFRRKEALSAMNDLLMHLDADRREVLNLRYGEGLSVQEVASRTGRSPGSIKMLIHRALLELREKFAGAFGDFSIE